MVGTRSGRLAMIDWEQGRTDQFLLSDSFHFECQVDILVRHAAAKRSVARILAASAASPITQQFNLSRPQIRALFAAYLTDASLQWFELRAQTGHRGVRIDPNQHMRGTMLDAVMDAQVGAIRG